MEVVMGRCFPLTGPGYQHNMDFPVVKKFIDEEKANYSLVSKNVNRKENKATTRSPVDEVTGLTEEDQGKLLPPYQAGVPNNPKQLAGVGHNQRFSRKDREPSPSKIKEVTADKKGHSNENPKVQSILRRTCSSSDPEERISSESLKAPNGKAEQECGREKELSWGKRAWEMTQRRKAQMREEFFKVPYEECNREAARSLGGRLNKSEPRLHILGKDKKKRNSLSYKRRVHFDLDYGEDEDRKPRSRSKSFEEPDPPRKVVVSIYSIDKPKSVIQPDLLSYCSTPVGPIKAARDTTKTQTRNTRPTDLDTLQQKVQIDMVERQQRPNYTKTPNDKTEKQTQLDQNQDITPTTAAPQSSSDGPTTATTDSAMTKRDNVTTLIPEDSHNTPHRPPRVRHDPLTSLQTVPNNTDAPCPPHSVSKNFAFLPEEAAPPPVPAPRSHLTKSHSLPGHTYHSSKSHLRETQQICSQPFHPRPNHLNLNSPSSVRAAAHIFTPTRATKTVIHGQEPTQAHTQLTTPRTQQSPFTTVPKASTTTATPTNATSTTSTASNTPVTLYTPTASNTPTNTRSPMVSSTFNTQPTSMSLTQFPNLLNAPVPMPRKRISVSQQTPTPESSPRHHHHTPTATHTQTTIPYMTHSILHHTSQNTNTGDFQTTKKVKPSTSITNKAAIPEENNKENDSVRQNQKTSVIDRENSVNILMTKGESYAKHNIIISSHKSSAPPSVSVRKMFIPVSIPSRSSPSPTPSCASSSCSFGSSGSSSGCYSGSPSPTPTPSPTRIRASGAPTDL